MSDNHSHCADEHHGDGHGHDHDHDHDHGTSDTQPNNLFSKIDLPNAVVLNSEHPASNVLKSWAERLDETRVSAGHLTLILLGGSLALTATP